MKQSIAHIALVVRDYDEAYGTVAVFKDIFGNLLDLIQPTK